MMGSMISVKYSIALLQSSEISALLYCLSLLNVFNFLNFGAYSLYTVSQLKLLSRKNNYIFDSLYSKTHQTGQNMILYRLLYTVLVLWLIL